MDLNLIIKFSNCEVYLNFIPRFETLIVVVVVVIDAIHAFAGSNFPFLHLTVTLSEFSRMKPGLHSRSYFPLAFGPIKLPLGKLQPLGCTVVVVAIFVVGISVGIDVIVSVVLLGFSVGTV